MASHLTDLVLVAKSRILSQYQKLTLRFVPLVAGIVGEVQTLEDALWGFYDGLQLDNATGDMLDRFGYLVQEPRETFADAEFRRLIKGKIVANGSRGRLDDFLLMLDEVLDGQGADVSLREVFPLALEVKVDDHAIVEPRRERMRRLLSKTRGATVRIMFLTSTTGDETQDFCFSGGNGAGFAGVSPTVAGGKFRSAKAAPF